MLKGFKEFIMRGNVVDLAVAVVIGAAFGAVVKAFVEDIITPIVAAIFGKPDFSNLYFTINGSVFKYGDFINALITFVSVAAAVYFFIVAPLNAIAERKARRRALGQPVEESAAEVSDEVALLTEIRDLLSTPRA
ncbi:large conductance mechanosensitive channel [Jatrophihabitans sp. GAS493]|uniref:large conductance mechanosensitive channel protein MscL n=1 Tax=Jatrophihabitans sp. GAS493 TaxID=1907575 RepID=UPI000BC0E05B|nr:large conductance mechanosensitive channel protein MscL [Jatrophihabitans sp. GAS493]SOD72504.1 large conductance mechanosensitive channel [Jatrophihabitans sp. GAS493]